MEARRHSTCSSFLHATEAFLAERPVENALIFGLASGASGPLDGTPWLVSVHAGDGACVGAAMATPPRKALLAPMTREAAAVVAQALAEDWAACPGVLIDVELTDVFATRWGEIAGAGMARGRPQRVHRLDAVTPLARRAPGAMRAATESDVPLLADWMAAFAEEALQETIPPQTERALQMLGRGEWRLFETEVDGRTTVVAMAARGRAVFGGESVRYVYTPPELRRRGYATTLVADLTEELLASGAAWCMLYTDLGNPTSNGIYAAIGYRAVQDVIDLMVTPD